MRPDGHPDGDLLADLAADVLPSEQARSVQAHVEACPRCGALLEESEHIRALLLADDPGPMPDAVAARIQAAIAAEWDHPVAAPSAARTSLSALPARPRPRVSRRRIGPQRTRRQALEEERDARPSRVGRWLAVAAGVTVLAVGGGAVLRWGPGHQATEAASGAATASSAKEAVGGTPARGSVQPATPVLATGTDYTAAQFEAQARALIARAPSSSFQRDTATTRAVPGPTAAPSAPVVAGPAAAGGASGQRLREPSALAACLRAINAAGLQPIAVDLATYQGRPAAILVLPGQGGGYEVWAVARDCRPGADGTMHFIAIRQP